MPFVAASDGTELYYEVEGDGFPLVFTHGNMGLGQQFFLQTRIFPHTEKPEIVNEALWQWLEEKMR
jgi:pimeloyl-ACP methyl ester carboxylesterase